MRISITKQLWLMCGGFLLILAIVGLVGLKISDVYRAKLEKVSKVDITVIRDLTNADMMHDGLRAVVMESIVAKQFNESEKMNELKNEVKDKGTQFLSYFNELNRLPLSQNVKSLINDVMPAITKYQRVCLDMVQIADSQGVEAVRAKMNDFNQIFELLEDKLGKIGEEIEKESHNQSDSSQFLIMTSLFLTIGGILFGLIVSFLVVKKLSNYLLNFIEKIQQTGDKVSKASSSMQEASKVLANGSTESAASLEETVAALEELSSMVKLNSENASEAAKISSESKHSAEAGMKEIKVLIQSMEEITRSSKRMEEIINVIDDIAFQTNLLALNAAVEAARAGEQGKGFAVVADAVRSLAGRSAVAAKDIAEMIRDSNQKISSGSQIVDRNGSALEKIFETVERVSSINTDIAQSSQEQSRGITQISETMSKIDGASQKNAEVASDFSQSSSVMAVEAENLEHLVDELRHVVGAKAA